MVHKPSTRKMSDRHEAFLATLFGDKSRIMPNSGAGWAKQMDVRVSHRDEEFAFAVDGKSTLGESIGVSKGMWEKAVDQSHNEIPALALRWYASYQLDPSLDLVVVDAETFRAFLEMAKQNYTLRREVARLSA